MTDVLGRPIGRLLGEPTARALGKLGLRTVGDVLRHYPRRLQDRGRFTELRDLPVGDHVTVLARVEDVQERPMHARRGVILNATISDGAHRLLLTFFAKHPGGLSRNRRMLQVGTTGLFTGTVTLYRGARQLAHPDFEVLGDLDDEAAAIERHMQPIPIYPATSAVPSWRIANAVTTLLRILTSDDVPDVVPPDVRRAEDLLGSFAALQGIHDPVSEEHWLRARRTLQFEEAFVLQSVLVRRREVARALRTVPRPATGGGILAAFDARLPFPLTAGQRAVGDQIAADLASHTPMQRLLQGEVGSGKTLVALRAMLQVVEAGGQAALLAPTEVLAQQHHRSIAAMLGPLALPGMLGGADAATHVELLTSSLPSRRRATALARAASGQAGLVIGTHALLGEEVQFHDLGLVVVDEQHRFGVEQRDVLRTRGGRTAHSLVMTATPIPRTVAMTVFGDLEVSTLREMPPGRGEVRTFAVPRDNAAWMGRMWQRCAEEVAAGGRVYVVCPRIDAGDTDTTGAAVTQTAAALRDEPALAGVAIGELHGRLAMDAKDRAMDDFASGRTPVLVATTVVEVGVDVADATVMVVLDADRFGLSQLHQLRGRIGRGGRPGVCFAVTGQLAGPAEGRVQAFVTTRDGFELAEKDLELRREGDVLGAAQSGLASSLTTLRVLADRDLIERARAHADALVARDPSFATVPALAAAVAGIEESSAGDFIERA